MSHPTPLTVRLATCAKPELAVFLLFLLFVVFFIFSGKHLWRSNFILCLSINSKTAFIFERDLLQVLLGKLASMAAIVLSFMAVAVMMTSDDVKCWCQCTKRKLSRVD